MIPDYLIYDELVRERETESEWKPEPLHLPLYVPHNRDDEPDVEEEKEDTSRGVIIIDMTASDF